MPNTEELKFLDRVEKMDFLQRIFLFFKLLFGRTK